MAVRAAHTATRSSSGSPRTTSAGSAGRRKPGSRTWTTLSSGGLAGSGPTWPASPGASRATGRSPTSGTRATSCPTRSCRRYPWLFDGSPRNPTTEALDLVAYLDSLGRAAQLAGGGPRSDSSPIDPESDEWCAVGYVNSVSPAIGPAPLFTTPADLSLWLPLRSRGAVVFEHHCRGCHGSGGGGDGPAAPALLPAPRDLTSASYSDRRLSDVLWHGAPGSSMPAWNELSSADLHALVTFVRSLTAREIPADDLLPPSPLDLTAAEALYEKNCSQCHGKTGGGDGLSARVLTPPPTNFRQVKPGMARAERALAEGVAGTGMPPWDTKLSEPERRALARYVRSFFNPEVPSPE